MKTRILLLSFAAFGALTMAPANAAITVITNGAARACYLAADSGANPNDYVQVCNMALNGALDMRDRAATLVNRGILKMSASDGSGANADFNRGLALNANMAEGYVDRGASLIMLKRYQDAITDIDRGIAMGAHKPHVAYYDRGIANEALGNVQAAFADYTQAQTIDPTFQAPANELKRFKVVSKPAGT